MPSNVKTPSRTWKADIRKTGFPTAVNAFRLKRDTEDWSRRTEDGMVRGRYPQRGRSEPMTFARAVRRYLADVTPTRRPLTQVGKKRRPVRLTAFFGNHWLAGITPEPAAEYCNERLAADDRASDGKARPRAGNTVHLELALTGHLFTIGIEAWG